ETLPDQNCNIVFTNAYGEIMLFVYHDRASGQEWKTYHRYDPQGREILTAFPSAVTGYDLGQADPIGYDAKTGHYQYLRDTSGLIIQTEYYGDNPPVLATETTPGGVPGLFQDVKIQQGQQGTLIPQQCIQYYQHTAGDLTVTPVATATVYPTG